MLVSKFRLGSLAVLIWTLSWFSIALGFNLEQIQHSFSSRYGQVISGELFKEWLQLLRTSRNASERERLQRVNTFFNEQIAFENDFPLWDKSDYWATPLETLARGRGDCEDYAIAKYFSLLELGTSINKLRLVYVRATIDNLDGSFTRQAHMVLAYYPTPDSEPLILDNINKKILPASKRPDLLPVFSFNSDGIWLDTGKNLRKISLSRWQELLARTRAEGFQ